jgi:ankyrin repeat protein
MGGRRKNLEKSWSIFNTFAHDPMHACRPLRTQALSSPALPSPLLRLSPDLLHEVVLRLGPELDSVRQLVLSCKGLAGELAHNAPLQAAWLLHHRGRRALQLAAAAGSGKLVRCLLDAGCSGWEWSGAAEPVAVGEPNGPCPDSLLGGSQLSAPSGLSLHMQLLQPLSCLPLHVACFCGNAAAASELLAAFPEQLEARPRYLESSQGVPLAAGPRAVPEGGLHLPAGGKTGRSWLPSERTTLLHFVVYGAALWAHQHRAEGSGPAEQPEAKQAAAMDRGKAQEEQASGPFASPESPSSEPSSSCAEAPPPSSPRHLRPQRPAPRPSCFAGQHCELAGLLLGLGADPHLGAMAEVVWRPGAAEPPPLLAAVECRLPELLAVMLQGGRSDPDLVHDCRPLLHYAVWTGCRDSVGALLDAGADPSKRGVGGCSALHVAVELARQPAVAGSSSSAASSGGGGGGGGGGGRGGGGRDSALAIAGALLAANAAPNQQSLCGRGPLHRAAMLGDLEMCRLLLAAGAEANLQQPDGSSSLHIACGAKEGQAALAAGLIAAELLQAGASVHLRTVSGATALQVAVDAGNCAVAELLLAAGADPNLLSDPSSSPLHAAAWDGHEDLVRVLLQAGALPGLLIEDGRAPLHLASWRGHLEVVRRLLLSGADPNVRSLDGCTPLASAKQYRHRRVMDLLIDWGARPLL